MKDFEAYLVGIVYASVCSALSLEETTARLNAEHPTGIRSQWELSPDKKFASGGDNPCPCDRAPTTHKHYLFNCREETQWRMN